MEIKANASLLLCLSEVIMLLLVSTGVTNAAGGVSACDLYSNWCWWADPKVTWSMPACPVVR